MSEQYSGQIEAEANHTELRSLLMDIFENGDALPETSEESRALEEKSRRIVEIATGIKDIETVGLTPLELKILNGILSARL